MEILLGVALILIALGGMSYLARSAPRCTCEDPDCGGGCELR